MPPRRSDHGITLIELLVVVIIIAILTAIAIPQLIKQREKGFKAAATADMKNAAMAVETFASQHDGSFVLINGADEDSPVLAGEGYNRSDWISLRVFATSADYCISGRHEEFPDQVFVFRSGTGVVEVGDPDLVNCIG